MHLAQENKLSLNDVVRPILDHGRQCHPHRVHEQFHVFTTRMPGDFRLCQGRISKTICILYKIIVLVDHVACLPLAMFQFENSCPLIPLWRRNNNSVLWSLEGPFWHRDDDGNLCIVQRLAVQFHFLILQLQKLCWWTNLPVDMMNIHLNSYCEYCKWCLIWYIHPPPQKKKVLLAILASPD